MSAHLSLRPQYKRDQIFVVSVVIVLLYLMISSKALANINPYHVSDLGDVVSKVIVDDRADFARAHLVIVPKLMPPASVSGGAVPWTSSRILKEVGKQAVDQPGHFLIGAAPIWASRCLVGVPWFGWVAAPILAYREWLQWPSSRWWDPPLDWAFLTLGAVAATWGRQPARRLGVGMAASRYSVAWRFAVRGRMRHAG
jgi:hypothetical protein